MSSQILFRSTMHLNTNFRDICHESVWGQEKIATELRSFYGIMEVTYLAKQKSLSEVASQVVFRSPVWSNTTISH